ncbi:MAG: helix-turn-helix domain-containing protein [Oscillospiraceae bacterium]
MTQGERIRALRTSLGLSLEAFGEKLGVTRAAMSNIERGQRNLTDQMAKSICREFNVSERWLRTGEGKMFLELSRDDEIAAYVGRVLKDENAFYQQKLLHILTKLSPEQLTVLEKYADFLLENSKKEQKD